MEDNYMKNSKKSSGDCRIWPESRGWGDATGQSPAAAPL